MLRNLRVRITLRFFLLICTAASLLIAWVGLIYQREIFAKRTQGTNYEWKRLGSQSGLWVNDNGEVAGADIRNAEDWAILSERNVELSDLEYLSIDSPDAFGTFQPREFPNIKKIQLTNVNV